MAHHLVPAVLHLTIARQTLLETIISNVMGRVHVLKGTGRVVLPTCFITVADNVSKQPPVHYYICSKIGNINSKGIAAAMFVTF